MYIVIYTVKTDKTGGPVSKPSVQPPRNIYCFAENSNGNHNKVQNLLGEIVNPSHVSPESLYTNQKIVYRLWEMTRAKRLWCRESYLIFSSQSSMMF